MHAPVGRMARVLCVSGLALAVVLSTFTIALAAELPPGGTFTDDDGNTHESNIEAIAAAGITLGCNPPDNDMFCPGDSVTRGQMAAFLVRALDLTDDGEGDLFVDDDDSVFSGDIDKLGTAGITLGCNPPDNDMYCPDDNVRRDQMASFLARALDLEPILPPPPPSGGLAFGVFFPPDDSWGSEFTGGFLNFSPATIIRDLNMVQDAGASMVISFVSKKESHQNPDETINVDMWKAAIDEYAGIDLSSYVADGTLLAHYMTDEPKSRGSWGGEIVHNEDIDEMARYSKSLWPTLPTTVRVSPSKLARHAGGYDVPLPDWEWQYLDIGWAQYSARFGSVTDYTDVEIAEANRQGLGLVFGLNVIDGGDGSSGVPGVGSEKWSMSAEELRDYAGTLIGSDGACVFLMWRYDWDGYVYFERPDIHEAVTELGALAASRDAPSCDLR